MSSSERIKDELRKKKKREVIKDEDFLSSGSTLLNLATTGRTHGCFAKGFYTLFVGDSESGKTWLCLGCLAEASINPEFDDYDLIYDNGEDGALMDIRHYYGKKLAKRIKPPAVHSDGTPRYSETVEQMYDNILAAAESGRPFVYIQDSQDSLSSELEIAKEKKQRRARETGDKAAGMYDPKARQHSARLRRVIRKLKKTRSILIIISQTRDKIGGFIPFGGETTTHSGGRAIKFYATTQLWSSVKMKLKRKIKGKMRQIGMLSKVRVKKNRFTGKDRTVLVPIFQDIGIDDVGSCVDYLIEEGHWKKHGGKIDAKELDFHGGREALIQHIEDEEEEKFLRGIVGKVWAEIEEACKSGRKRRYG